MFLDTPHVPSLAPHTHARTPRPACEALSADEWAHILRFLPPLEGPRCAAVSRALRAGALVRTQLLERTLPAWQPRPEAPALRLAYRPALGWAVVPAKKTTRRRDRTPLWSALRRRSPGWWLAPDCVVLEVEGTTQMLLSCYARGTTPGGVVYTWPSAVVARVAIPASWSALIV